MRFGNLNFEMQVSLLLQGKWKTLTTVDAVRFCLPSASSFQANHQLPSRNQPPDPTPPRYATLMPRRRGRGLASGPPLAAPPTSQRQRTRRDGGARGGRDAGSRSLVSSSPRAHGTRARTGSRGTPAHGRPTPKATGAGTSVS